MYYNKCVNLQQDVIAGLKDKDICREVCRDVLEHMIMDSTHTRQANLAAYYIYKAFESAISLTDENIRTLIDNKVIPYLLKAYASEILDCRWITNKKTVQANAHEWNKD